MSWKVQITPKAKEALDRVPESDRADIAAAIEGLASDPYAGTPLRPPLSHSSARTRARSSATADTTPPSATVTVRLWSHLLNSIAIEAQKAEVPLEEVIREAIVRYLVDFDEGMGTLEIVGDPEAFPHDYERVMGDLEREEEGVAATEAGEGQPQ